MLKADGFDDAVIGIGRRCGQEDLIIYDIDKCINVLQTKPHNMTCEEATEYFWYNVAGSWVGKRTPMFLEKKTIQEIEEDAKP